MRRINRVSLQHLLNGAVASGDVPYIAAAITGPDALLFQGMAGLSSPNGPPVTADTPVWLASMTKPITSVAAMQLVEAGKLSLDAPIGALLPELAHPQILENGTFRPAETKITLRHLLTHTAGFSYPYASPDYAAYFASLPTPPKPGTRAALNAPLLCEPGTRWEYGLSTDWVGLAVEAASGLTLDAYFAAHIFAPLGMACTGFTPGPATAWLHRRAPDGTLTPTPPPPATQPEVLSGGAGLYSTLADYLKFLRIFLNGGGGILTPASLAEMCRNQIGPLRAGHLRSITPGFMLDTDINPGIDNKWGLGFLINPQTGPNGRPAGCLSWAGAANTYFWIDPAARRAALLLTQILPFSDAGALKTYSRFEHAVYPSPQLQVIRPSPTDRDIMP